MVIWCCIKSCGVCCYLDLMECLDLEEYLFAEEVEYYMSLIGVDGWCINYDFLSWECCIYFDRLKFCWV